MIESQLERLVTNTYFSHSRRFPSFLRFVVNETLSGNTEYLKERTIGIEIFGKHPDYDTATEPIVRVTAAEIRKRIAQYYQEPGHEQEMRFSLPPGSYIPQFEFPEVRAAMHEPVVATMPSAAIPVEAAALAQAARSWILWFSLAVLLLLGCAAAFSWKQERQTALTEFWSPIFGGSDRVLFSVADQTQYDSLTLRDAADPSHLVKLNDHLTAVIIDDLNIITKIAGVLQAANKRFELRGEGATTLSDLRNGPSVIVGAFDNAWTLRLLAPLHFHFANNAEMTSFSIVETKDGGRTWVVDRTRQMATNNYKDYAIVARFTDATTGRPTLIAAGIGRGGTIAAGEFLTSSELLRKALQQQPNSHTQNVEVVLSTQIIDGEPGTPTIEGVYYW